MICDTCLHADVCGVEGSFEESLTYCADYLGWIPVTERLPEKNTEYLVAVGKFNITQIAMSQSIGSKLSSLKYKGLITDTEYDRLKKALNSLRIDEMYQLEMENAEEFIAKSVIDDIKAEIELQKKGFPPSSDYYKAITRAVNIIDTRISALNNDQFERIWQNTVEEMKRRKICEDILEEAEEWDSETMSGSLLTDDDLRLLINDAIKEKKAEQDKVTQWIKDNAGFIKEMAKMLEEADTAESEEE